MGAGDEAFRDHLIAASLKRVMSRQMRSCALRLSVII